MLCGRRGPFLARAFCHPRWVSTKVKICGMTNLEDAEHAASLGAWAIGLIHHAPSPRFVDPAVAEQIGAALRRRVEIAGVFVNAPLDEVIRALYATAETGSVTS